MGRRAVFKPGDHVTLPNRTGIFTVVEITHNGEGLQLAPGETVEGVSEDAMTIVDYKDAKRYKVPPKNPRGPRSKKTPFEVWLVDSEGRAVVASEVFKTQAEAEAWIINYGTPPEGHTFEIRAVAAEPKAQVPNNDENATETYLTPPELADAICHRLFQMGITDPRLACEPSAGQGNILRAMKKQWADLPIIAFDVREECREPLTDAGADHVVITPFEDVFADTALTEEIHAAGGFDLVVMNPPFSKAMQHVETALGLCAPHGIVAVLLKLAYLTDNEARVAWWDRMEHQYAVGMHRIYPRPSFIRPDGSGGWLTGGSDSQAYAWFLFSPSAREIAPELPVIYPLLKWGKEAA